MRIRQVKPAFWSDEDTASLVDPTDTALFYIGLWMQADDSGYLRWEPRRIAAELYPYADPTVREAAVLHHKLRLEELRKLRVFRCGHAVIPRMIRHQRLAGATHQVHTVRDEHNRCSPRKPAVPRGSPRRLGKRLGQVRLGNRAGAHEESENGMSTIEEHDAQIERPLSDEEKVATWLDLWRNPSVGRKAMERAERELEKLGYHREGKDWVK